MGLITTDVNEIIQTFKHNYRTRNYDPNNFYLNYPQKQDYFRQSYFIRTVNIWNTLSTETKSIDSLNIFKQTLFDLYKRKTETYTPPG